MDTPHQPPTGAPRPARPLDLAAGAVVSHLRENGRPVYPDDQLATDLAQALEAYHEIRHDAAAARIKIGQLTPIGAATVAALELIGVAHTPAAVEAAAEAGAQLIRDAAENDGPDSARELLSNAEYHQRAALWDARSTKQ